MRAVFWMTMILLFAAPSFGQLNQLEITDAEGNQLMLESYLDDNRNHLIIFWASWCSICRNELSSIESFYDSWSNEYNTEVVAISMDSESGRANARSLFENNAYPYDLIFAPASEVRDALGISSQPHTYLIDQDFNQIYYKRGFRSGDENEIDAEIRNAFESSGAGETSAVTNNFSVSSTSDGFLLQWESPLKDDAQLTLYNSLGQNLGMWTASSGNTQYSIPVSKNGEQSIILEVRTGLQHTARLLR
jgi:thiol-disulfide isomerase/thioredoxin